MRMPGTQIAPRPAAGRLPRLMLTPMSELPPDIINLAFRSTSGEYAWRRTDIDRAIEAIRTADMALLGWEAWLVNDTAWTGLIPSAADEPLGVWAFSTEPRAAAETWPDYRDRTAAETRQQLATAAVEECSRPEVRPMLRFNLTYVDQDHA